MGKKRRRVQPAEINPDTQVESEPEVDELPPGDGMHRVTLRLPHLILDTLPKLDAHETTLQCGRQLLCTVEMVGGDAIRCTAQDGRIPLPIGSAAELIEFELTSRRFDSLPTIELDRAWVQTVVNREQRRDRVVYSVRSTQPDLRFRLPSAWTPSAVKVMVNGERRELEVEPDKGTYRLVLRRNESSPIPQSLLLSLDSTNSTASPSHSDPLVVELWHWSSDQRSFLKPVDLHWPMIEGFSDHVPLIWQVAIPPQEHLWSASSSLLADHRWVWRNLTWNRRANASQRDLELSFHASTQPDLPAGTNQYLFHTLGGRGNHEALRSTIYIVPNYLFWLPVATISLLLTGIWPNFSVLRYPWMLLAVALLLGILAISFPDMAIMLIQAALGSLLVVAIVRILAWAARQRVHRRSVFANRAGQPLRPATRLAPDEELPETTSPTGRAPVVPSTQALSELPPTVTEASS